MSLFWIFKRKEVKTINARIKTNTVLESTSNSAQNYTKRFSIFYFFYFYFSFQCFQRYAFLTFDLQLKKLRVENWTSLLCIVLCWIRCGFQNCLCFFPSIDSFWLLFFWRFKSTFYRRGKYVYICIYWVLLRGFDAINASNQWKICSCMIFQPSCFILYFINSINSVVLCEIFYNDVTTLLWRH